MASKLLQEKEMYRRKLARAKRISRIQRKNRIDRYIKNRVYTITLFLSITIVVLSFLLNNSKNIMADQSKSIRFANELLEQVEKDGLMKMNMELARAVDSLQILIFVYNRRHQQDQKDIQYFMIKSSTKNRRTHKNNKLEFPKYVGEDSLKYDFFPDTITNEDSISFSAEDTTIDTIL